MFCSVRKIKLKFFVNFFLIFSQLLNHEMRSVFVQSAACSLRNQWHVATVVKVPAEHNLEVFNAKFFADYMHMQRLRGYNETLNLQKLCTIRISFVKGWGERYRRQVIYSFFVDLIFHFLFDSYSVSVRYFVRFF